MFRIMKRAGCRVLLVGFESGDRQILERIGKNATPEDARRFMEIANQEGIDVHGCFVLGLPGETMETMDKTITFALGLGLHTVQFSGAVPFPGTQYYDYCRDQGLIAADRWDAWLNDGEQTAVVEYPGLTAAQINQAIDRGLRSFYLRPSYMVKFLFRTRSRSDLYRKIRGAKNFFSYLWIGRRGK